jgi:hypothetical protein
VARRLVVRRPTFPLTIKSDDGEIETVDNEVELCRQLEWFDSTDGDNTVQVVDATGASVVVVIEAFEIRRLEVANS